MAKEMSRLTERLVATAKPLTRTEERAAIKAALTNLGEGAFTVRGAELSISKPDRRGAAPARRIAVVVTEQDKNVVHEVMVTTGGKVVDATCTEGVVVPFSSEEIERAVALAAADPTAARIARRKGVIPAVFYPSNHTHGRRSRRTALHRRVGLHYLSAGRPSRVVAAASVVVDLHTGQVESVTVHETSDANRGGR